MAAVISATLSAGSGDLLGAATVFTKDIWQQYVQKGMTDQELVKFSKITVLVFGILAIGISLCSKEIIPMLVFAFTMRSTGPFAAFILGLSWKKATPYAGIWSIVLGTAAGLYWQYINEPYGIMAIIFGAVVSCAVFIIVVWIEKLLHHNPAPPAL